MVELSEANMLSFSLSLSRTYERGREPALDGYRTDSSWITMFSLVVRCTEKTLQDACGLTSTQYFILLALLVRGEKTMGELSDILEIKRSTISEAANQLERSGLVVRHSDKEDGRKVRIGCSPSGETLSERADKAILGMINDLWQPFGQETVRRVLHFAAKGASASNKQRMQSGLLRSDTSYIVVVYQEFHLAEQVARSLGFPLNQLRVCQYLQEQGRPTSCGEISRSLLMRPNQVTAAKNELARHALIAQNEGADRRSVYLELKEEGRELANRYVNLLGKRRKEHTRDHTSESQNEEATRLTHIMLAYQRKLGRYLA